MSLCVCVWPSGRRPSPWHQPPPRPPAARARTCVELRVYGLGRRAQGPDGSEAGSHLRLMDLVNQSTLGLRVIKKKRRGSRDHHRSPPRACNIADRTSNLRTLHHTRRYTTLGRSQIRTSSLHVGPDQPGVYHAKIATSTLNMSRASAIWSKCLSLSPDSTLRKSKPSQIFQGGHAALWPSRSVLHPACFDSGNVGRKGTPTPYPALVD